MSVPQWRQKRRGQGYSYAEVVSEIRRRAAGNYILPKKENAQRLREALLKAKLLFELSADLHDFMEARQLSANDIGQGLFGMSDMADALNTMLDPFPVGDKKTPIELDGIIDYLYPGKDCDPIRSNFEKD